MRRLTIFLVSILAALAACTSAAAVSPAAVAPAVPGARSGVWYEIFVRAWADSDGDGIGDLAGVTRHLDYLQQLGVDGIWLMPIQPSPSYHGYDVTDYYGIQPQYGDMADFHTLVTAAHKRGIRVILDLVVNHTSDRHPWFQAALRGDPKYRDWYTWAGAGSDLAAISATGGPAWHAAPGGHYLGVFTAQMPDLDYDTPAVRAEIERVGQFWLRQGADGFRLDAAQHIYYDLAGQRDAPQVLRRNLRWWSQFHRAMRAVRPDAYLVGEVTRETPEQLAPYFGPLSAVFDFPLAERLLRSAREERDAGLGAWVARTDAAYRAASGHSGVDATFLANHDQERAMSQLDGDPRHMRMAAALLLTLPGNAFVYYGEELGMRGRKPDPDLREPMRWYRDPAHAGQSRWKPFSAGDPASVSVQAERDDPHSLLSWYRTLAGWRRQLAPLRDGRLAAVDAGDPALVAWTLSDATARVLVVHNLGGHAHRLALGAPALRRFALLRLRSGDGVRLRGDTLVLPPYSSAVLEDASR